MVRQEPLPPGITRAAARLIIHGFCQILHLPVSEAATGFLAEKVGFELTDRAGRTLVLEISALKHSTISPGLFDTPR